MNWPLSDGSITLKWKNPKTLCLYIIVCLYSLTKWNLAVVVGTFILKNGLEMVICQWHWEKDIAGLLFRSLGHRALWVSIVILLRCVEMARHLMITGGDYTVSVQVFWDRALWNSWILLWRWYWNGQYWRLCMVIVRSTRTQIFPSY